MAECQPIVAETREGVARGGGNPGDVSPLLEDVAAAAARVRELGAEQRTTMDAAREELRAKVRAARDEGISYAAIARAAGVSREWVRRLYTGE